MVTDTSLRRILRRRHAFRFPLELPTLVRWEDEGASRTIGTYTKNINSSGFYVLVDQRHRPPSDIDFEVALPASPKKGTGVLLRGKGHLIRFEDLGTQAGLAAAIDRVEMRRATRLTGRAFQWKHRSRLLFQ